MSASPESSSQTVERPAGSVGPMQIRVLLYSDDRSTRDEVRLAVGRRPSRDVEVSAWMECATPAAAEAAAKTKEYDLLILDGEAARDLEEILDPHVVLVLDTEPALPGTIGVACPFAGGLRPMSDLVDGGTQGLSPAAQLIVGRHLPVMGHLVWSQGRIGAEVAVACARTGAAVIDFHAPPPPYVPEADLVVLDDPDRLADLRGRRPRIIVLVCDDVDADRAAAAVDDLGIPGPVAVEHLAVTDEDGSTTSAYLTTVYVEQEPSLSAGEHS